MENNMVLSLKQKGIISIATFTADGDLDRPKTALKDRLDVGLTVNEIDERFYFRARIEGWETGGRGGR